MSSLKKSLARFKIRDSGLRCGQGEIRRVKEIRGVNVPISQVRIEAEDI